MHSSFVQLNSKRIKSNKRTVFQTTLSGDVNRCLYDLVVINHTRLCRRKESTDTCRSTFDIQIVPIPG